MTKTCVVCKKQPIPGDTSRSFHKFPPSEEYKKLWMEATGITKLSVNYTVCSDHFTPESFHQTDGYTSVNRLVRNAVPIKRKSDIDNEEPDEVMNGAKSTKNGAPTPSYISCRIPVLDPPTQPVPSRNGVRKRTPNTSKSKAKGPVKNNSSPCKAPGDNIVHITLPILKVKRNDLPAGTIAETDSSDNMLILNNSDSCALLGNISQGAANSNCKLELSGEADACKSTQNDVAAESQNLPCDENAVSKRIVVISSEGKPPSDTPPSQNKPVATRKSTRKVSKKIEDFNHKEKYCFRDGAQQHYLYRSDFVSEEAWGKFLRLMLENKRRLQAMRQRLSRKRREYLSKHGEESQEESKDEDQEMYGAATFLEVVLKE